MPYEERGPAHVAPRVGAVATFIDTQIVVHRLNEGQPCTCTAIEICPSGEQFVASVFGTHHHNGSEWRLVADFVGCLHGSSFDKPSVPVRLCIYRAGKWSFIEVSHSEFESARWVARLLGADAAASVTDYDALSRAIRFFGFVVSECRGCRHES